MYKGLLFLIVFSLSLICSDRFDLPFDETKLENYDGKSDLSNYIGMIQNQVWIYSKKLSKDELEDKILSMYQFKIVTYDDTYGLLVEYDNNDIVQVEIIEKIKNMENIDNVFHRVFRGSEVFKPMKFETINLEGDKR